MDRIRVGLTGLGAVFLITLGATLVFGDGVSSGNSPAPDSKSSEFLAQLGVAPGADKDQGAPPSANPAPGQAAGGAVDSQGNPLSSENPASAGNSGPATVPAPFDTMADDGLSPASATPARPATHI